MFVAVNNRERRVNYHLWVGGGSKYTENKFLNLRDIKTTKRIFFCDWISDSVGLGWDQRTCISDKFPDDVFAGGLITHSEN